MTDQGFFGGPRRLYIFLFLVLILGPSFHSASAQVEIRPGIRSGLSSTTMASFPGSLERRTGYAAGVFAVVNLPGPFAVQPELLYVQKGATAPEPTALRGGSGYMDSYVSVVAGPEIEVEYLELPVLGTLRMPGVPLVTPTIVAGPTVGVSVTSDLAITDVSYRWTEEDLSEGERFEPEYTDPAAVEVGGLVGVGMEVDLGRATLSLDGRYRFGVTDVGREPIPLGYNRGRAITFGIAL